MRWILFLLLVGCTTTSEVTQLDRNTYIVGASDSSGSLSHTDVKTLGIKRAQEYCASLSKSAAIKNATSRGARYWTSVDAEVTFQCVTQ